MTTSPKSSHQKIVQFLLLFIIVIGLLMLGRFVQIDEAMIKGWLGDIPLGISSLLFIVIYVVLTTLIWLGPKDILRIFAALVYGAVLSTALIWAAEMINAVILFLLSRKLGREFVEEKLKGKSRRLDQMTSSASAWWIFIMRMFLVPFRFLDLGFGLTAISLKKYLCIIAIASPLRIYIFQYMLSLGKEVYSNPDALAQALYNNPAGLAVMGLYMVGAIIFMFVFSKKMSA